MTNLHNIDDLVGLMSGDEGGADLAQYLPLLRISPDGDQPRRDFDAEALAQLAESIRAQGVLQPIIVRPDPAHAGDYIIVAGERRYHGAGQAGLSEIPAMVRDLSVDAIRAIQLIENVDREPLSPLDEAQAIAAMIEAGASGADVARLLGKSEGWISQRKKVAGAAPLLLPFKGRCGDVETLAALVDLHRYSPADYGQFAEGFREPSRAAVRSELRRLKAEAEAALTHAEPELPGLPPRALDADKEALDPDHTEDDDEDNDEPPPPPPPKPKPLSEVLATPDKDGPDTEREDDDESAPAGIPDDAALMDLEGRMGSAVNCPVIIDRDAQGKPVGVSIFVDSWAEVNRLAGLLEKLS